MARKDISYEQRLENLKAESLKSHSKRRRRAIKAEIKELEKKLKYRSKDSYTTRKSGK